MALATSLLDRSGRPSYGALFVERFSLSMMAASSYLALQMATPTLGASDHDVDVQMGPSQSVLGL